MRITAGSLKGRQLSAPKNSKVRPTTDKTRQAVFSALYDEVIGAKVLDCFAGTGAFGIEAVSRGAEFCLFIDTDLRPAQANLKLLDKSSYKCLRGDFLKAVQNISGQFDIIFIDPPYGVIEPSKILKAIKDKGIVNKGGIVIYEESIRTEFSGYDEFFTLTGEKKYGETKIYYLRDEQ